jgi:aspartate kinase
MVIKLGGDALATSQRIAAAAERVLHERQQHQVVVVTSARRGVTDHLLALTRGVESASGGGDGTVSAVAERAIAAGEVVSAALVAAALVHRRCPAVPLDAREAGILGGGPAGAARLRRIRPGRLRALLARGIVPVVTGFQVWDGGNVRMLDRGGSDLSAVALAAALGGGCTFYKAHGLRVADPARQPGAPPAGRIDHARLAMILADGSLVLHRAAARLAARHDVPLRFVPFPDSGEESWVVNEVGDPSLEPRARPRDAPGSEGESRIRSGTTPAPAPAPGGGAAAVPSP